VSDLEQLAAGLRQAAADQGQLRPIAEQVRHLSDRRHRRRSALVAPSPDGAGWSAGTPTTRGVRSGALVDVDTGRGIPSPVPGRITAAMYQPDGTLLLRTVDGGVGTLSLLGPAGAVVAQTRESSDQTRDSLLAYIP
jgi:hypothetical protein